MERLEKLQWTSAPTLASCSMAVIRSRRRAMFTAQGSRYQKSAGNGSRCCCSGEWLPMFFLDLGIPLCYWIAAHLSIECTCWFLSLAKVMDEMWYLSWFNASSTKFSNSGTSLKIWILPRLWTTWRNIQNIRWRYERLQACTSLDVKTWRPRCF